jgi:hypothetical protein
MSWSVSYIGTPQKVAEALYDESRKLSGQSKVEFDAALPNLACLVGQNFTDEENGKDPPIVKLTASGHGSATGIPGSTASKQIDRNCVVSLERIWVKILS